ncbi:MAG: glycosyltransferase family 4 protein [Deltaproteobacteria bacterium]|nr:glycosyltransferase family 4 protein [Deltaproteobacteria bacterium]
MNPPCNKIKVAHVITRFDKGGSAENTFITVRDLDKARYDIVLITGASPPGNAGDPETKAIQANVNSARGHHVRLICLRHLLRDLRPFSDLATFFSLLWIIRREKPHIVHTHTSKAGILGRWAAWFCRVPVIVHTPHGHVFWGYFKSWQTRLFMLLERWTARITTAIVTLTPQEKEDHLRFRIAPEEKFTVIHSGVDLRTFRADLYPPLEAKALLGIPPGMTVVGTVGRLTPVKGQEVLIRAASELICRGEKIFLVLLGNGELRQDLEQLTIRLGIAEYVRFLGWRSDVARVMAACDVFCLPSRNEGMGKVLVESMAMGKPIVASRIGGIPDIVRPGENGILVPVGDAAAWAEAIARLCRDPEERRQMGDAGMQMAPRYSSEEMIKRIDQMYGKLLNKIRF